MTSSLPKESVAALRVFISLLQKNPVLLYDDSLGFFREYLVSLGAAIPPKPEAKPDVESKTESAAASGDSSMPQDTRSPAADLGSQDKDQYQEEDEDDPEVIKNLDDTPSAPMGTADRECTEEEFEEQAKYKAQARDLVEEGKLEEALELFNKAVQLGHPSPLLYASRAAVFLKMKKFNSAIKDCDAALEINPDSAKALKMRGTAYRYLGKWEQAARDLQQGLSIDFDEDSFAMQKVVEEHWNKIRHKRQLREAQKREAEAESARKEREERRRKAQEEYEKQRMQEETHTTEASGDDDEDGIGAGLEGLLNSLSPEAKEKMNDPKVKAKLQKATAEMKTNPMALMQYLSDPDLAPLFEGLMSGFSKGGPGPTPPQGFGGWGTTPSTGGPGAGGSTPPPTSAGEPPVKSTIEEVD